MSVCLGHPPEDKGEASKKLASSLLLATCLGWAAESPVPKTSMPSSLLQLLGAKLDASLCMKGDSQEGSGGTGLRLVIWPGIWWVGRV